MTSYIQTNLAWPNAPGMARSRQTSDTVSAQEAPRPTRQRPEQSNVTQRIPVLDGLSIVLPKPRAPEADLAVNGEFGIIRLGRTAQAVYETLVDNAAMTVADVHT